MNPPEHQARWNNPRSSPWRRWRDWALLSDEAVRPDADPGAYVLGIRRRGRQVSIPRLLGVDRLGILDIGESGNLRVRIAALAKCARADGVTGHMAGWRYRYLGLYRKLGGELVVSWKYGPASYGLEAETMAVYLNAFGELPPLNYKANWSLLRAERGEVAADV